MTDEVGAHERIPPVPSPSSADWPLTTRSYFIFKLLEKDAWIHP